MTYLVGVVFFSDGNTLQIQGQVIRNITIDINGVILTDDLISTNIAVVVGTASKEGAQGNWRSD